MDNLSFWDVFGNLTTIPAHHPIISLSGRSDEGPAPDLHPFGEAQVGQCDIHTEDAAPEAISWGKSYQFFSANNVVTIVHWIGLRKNLQETMVFTIKYGFFL